MSQTVFDPITPDVTAERREYVQEEFCRHLMEQRNRIASVVREWIETDKKFPIPIYEVLISRIRHLDARTRADVASVSLLMADEIITGVLALFARGEEF